MQAQLPVMDWSHLGLTCRLDNHASAFVFIIFFTFAAPTVHSSFMMGPLIFFTSAASMAL